MVAAISVGVDIGQRQDPSAIVVAECFRRPTGRMVTTQYHGDGSFTQEPETESAFRVHLVESVPLGTSYEAVAERVATVTAGARLKAPGSSLSVRIDQGGNRSFMDLARRALASSDAYIEGVTITATDRLEHDPGELRVGKSYLVNRLEVLFEQERIELPESRPETEALLLELKAFERHRTERAHLIFGARSGAHDDLVIALALAVLEDPGVFSVGPRFWR